ncbi:hypothetical protein AC628_15130 [Bradyrhizobium sp. NAS96.2]|nr:hypothetical protein AC628_15130 [Bradyrhizobium sp. NAS96.2]
MRTFENNERIGMFLVTLLSEEDGLVSWTGRRHMFAVEPCPSLLEIPGMDHPIRLADILAALRCGSAWPLTPFGVQG